MKEPVNIFAISISAFVNTAIGFLWFMVIFKHSYIEELAKTSEQIYHAPSVITASCMQLAGNFLMTFILAVLLKQLDKLSLGEALRFAVLIWIGFIAAITAPMFAYQAFSIKFFMITTLYSFICLLIAAAILTLWK